MSPRRAKAIRGRVGEDPATALRELLIDTADRLLTERAVGTFTTRDITRAAGVSEGVLYNYFADKNDLLLTTLIRRFGRLVDRFGSGLPAPGTGEVEQNLTTYATAALHFIAETLPMAVGLVTDPALLHRFITAVHHEPFGQHLFQRPVVDYLSGEQRLGRLGPGDPDTASILLLGAALHLAIGALMPEHDREDVTARLAKVVRLLLAGLAPAPQQAESPDRPVDG